MKNPSLPYALSIPAALSVSQGALGVKRETVAELPGFSSSCTMKECKGLLPAFGVSCAPHSERKTRPALLLQPHPVDTLWHLTIASMAAFHRIGRRGEPRVSEQRQRCVQRGSKALLQRGTEGGDPLEMPPQRGPCVEGRLGLPAPIA